MKKRILLAAALLIVFLLGLIGAIYYSPHFLIKFLLNESLKDLQKSGVSITLTETERRRTVVHLTIPKIGLINLELEPKLRLSNILPPSLEVSLAKSLPSLSIFETQLKDFVLHIEGRNLLYSPQVDFSLKAQTGDDPRISFELKANSQALSSERVHWVGTFNGYSGKDFVKGPVELDWKPDRAYPVITAGLISNLYDAKQPLLLDFREEMEKPRLLLSHTGFSLPSLSKEWEFSLNVKATLQGSGDIRLTGYLSEVSTKLRVKLGGEFKKQSDTWTGSYSLPVEFTDDFQPYSLFPKMNEELTGWEGKLDIQGRAQWKKGKFSATHEVHIQNLSGYVFDTPVINFNTKFSLHTYPHLATKQPVTIKIEKVGEELSLDDVELRFALSPTTLWLQEGKGRIKEGEVTLKPTFISLSTYEADYLITLQQMDLSRFLASFKSERLSGEGKVGGKFPLHYKKGRLLIDDAMLFNEGPGKIRYKDPSVEDVKEKIEYLADFNDLLARGQQALAFKALSDFHYSTLELHATRTGTEHLSIALHLKGKNPSLAKGQPFEINLPISGNLESFLIDSLLKSSMESEE